MFDFDSKEFLYNDMKLLDVKNYSEEIKKLRLFEMDYPYFSKLSDSYLAFTTDFGIIVL